MDQSAQQKGNTNGLTETANGGERCPWRDESQKRVRNAKVLISGVGKIGAVVARYLIRLGVENITLRDDKIVPKQDVSSPFMTTSNALGENRAVDFIKSVKTLNRLVKLSADTGVLAEKNEEYFKQFDVVVVSEANNLELVRVDEICRKHGVKFFACDIWGKFGFFFADLKRHKFVEGVKHVVTSKPYQKVITVEVGTPVHREFNFPSYQSIVDFDVSTILASKRRAVTTLRILQMFRLAHNRDPCYKRRAEDIIALRKLRNEITSAELVRDECFEHLFSRKSRETVVDSALGLEIITAISQKDAPICNLFIVDPITLGNHFEKFGLNEGQK